MMRKIFLLLVLAGGLLAAFGAPIFSGVGHPSEGALPVPWENTPRLSLFPAEVAYACDPVMIAAPGQTLTDLASRCGVTPAALLRANPTLTNFSMPLDGVLVRIPPECPGSLCGGGSDAPSRKPETLQTAKPGQSLYVTAAGLGANESFRVALGLSQGTFAVLAEGVADTYGRASLSLTIPHDALSGDTAFLILTTQSTPVRQAFSEVFTIAAP